MISYARSDPHWFFSIENNLWMDVVVDMITDWHDWDKTYGGVSHGYILGSWRFGANFEPHERVRVGGGLHWGDYVVRGSKLDEGYLVALGVTAHAEVALPGSIVLRLGGHWDPATGQPSGDGELKDIRDESPNPSVLELDAELAIRAGLFVKLLRWDLFSNVSPGTKASRTEVRVGWRF